MRNQMAFSDEGIEFIVALLRSYVEDSKDTEEPEDRRDLGLGLLVSFETMRKDLNRP